MECKLSCSFKIRSQNTPKASCCDGNVAHIEFRIGILMFYREHLCFDFKCVHQHFADRANYVSKIYVALFGQIVWAVAGVYWSKWVK